MRRPRASRRRRPDNLATSDPDPADTAKVRKTALNLLARREHSTLELKEKLIRRDFAPGRIEQVLESLAQDGLLSDERFAEAFVATRVRRGQGPLRIRRELDQRGVAAALAARHLDAYRDAWLEIASNARRKRFGVEPRRDYTERARQARFLQYRGFSTAQIMQVLDADDVLAGS